MGQLKNEGWERERERESNLKNHVQLFLAFFLCDENPLKPKNVSWDNWSI